MVAALQSCPVAPVFFAGRQRCNGIVPDFDLYTLTAPIPGHPEGSTVSAETLERAGYRLPPDMRASATAPVCALAPLPTAAECPAQLCLLEVVPHPVGGYTLAMPVDATRSTVRVYRGQWSTRECAQSAIDQLF